MKYATTTLLAALLFASPAFAQDDAPEVAPLGDEAETDLLVINGVPVNPELLERVRETHGEERSVQDLIDLSMDVLDEQRDQLAEQGGGDRSWMGEDPLGHLENEMQELVMEIDEGDTSDRTQDRGQDVVDKMGMLIAMLEETAQACSQCNGNGQGQGQRPGNGPANGQQNALDSTLSGGPGGSGDLNAAGDGNNLFGELDPAQRDAILRARQGQQGFSPEIDALLDEYYQRLASEQALDTADDFDDEAGDE